MTILRAIGSAIVAVLGLAAIFWVDLRLRRRLASRLERVSPSLTHRVLGHDLRPALFSTGRTLVDAVAWAFRILVVYVALAVVLQQIPYTRPWGEHLGTFLFGILRHLGAQAIGALPGLLAAVIIFVAIRLVARTIDRLLIAAEDGSISLPWLHPATVPATRRIVKVLIWLFALTVAYPYLPGSETPPSGA